MFLPTKKGVSNSVYHPSLHKKEYYIKVNEALRNANSKEDILFILDDIREQLLEGTFIK